MIVTVILIGLILSRSIIFSIDTLMIFLILNFFENLVINFSLIKLSPIFIFVNNLLYGPLKENYEYTISKWFNLESPLTLWIMVGMASIIVIYNIFQLIIKKIRKRELDRYTLFDSILKFTYIQYSWTTSITTEFLINIEKNVFWILFPSIMYLTLVTFGLQAYIFKFLYGKKSFFYRKKYNWLIYYQTPYYKWFILYLFIEKIIYATAWTVHPYFYKILSFVPLLLLNLISLICHIKFKPFINYKLNYIFIISKIILLVSSIYCTVSNYLDFPQELNSVIYVIILVISNLYIIFLVLNKKKRNIKKIIEITEIKDDELIIII